MHVAHRQSIVKIELCRLVIQDIGHVQAFLKVGDCDHVGAAGRVADADLFIGYHL